MFADTLAIQWDFKSLRRFDSPGFCPVKNGLYSGYGRNIHATTPLQVCVYVCVIIVLFLGFENTVINFAKLKKITQIL